MVFFLKHNYVFIKNKSCLCYQGGHCTLTQETNPEKKFTGIDGKIK